MQSFSCEAAVVGGGPAGLMAAQELASAGVQVHLFDAMPSVGRKFLLAGKGGLNLTHSEAIDVFMQRYGTACEHLQPALQDFGPEHLRSWAHGLEVETFVGTSGRVFPKDMKAAPLLRAWLHRLRSMGVRFHMRHRWSGWDDDGALNFTTPAGRVVVQAQAVVLALGGASWPRLGSDGAWVPLLQSRKVRVERLRPANCGFEVLSPAQVSATPAMPGSEGGTGWTAHFAERHAGQPFKSVAIVFTDRAGHSFRRKGEFVATARGVEGSLVYAVSALLRDEIEARGRATFHLDLLPDLPIERVQAQVSHPRGSRSLSSHLKGRLGLEGIKMGLLHEILSKDQMADAGHLANAIKALPITVVAARPVDEAISTAGGVVFDELDAHLMLQSQPGVFFAGEMLDWEAPTGGYLLTACMATGARAGRGAAGWLRR